MAVEGFKKKNGSAGMVLLSSLACSLLYTYKQGQYIISKAS